MQRLKQGLAQLVSKNTGLGIQVFFSGKYRRLNWHQNRFDETFTRVTGFYPYNFEIDC